MLDQEPVTPHSLQFSYKGILVDYPKQQPPTPTQTEVNIYRVVNHENWRIMFDFLPPIVSLIPNQPCLTPLPKNPKISASDFRDLLEEGDALERSRQGLTKEGDDELIAQHRLRDPESYMYCPGRKELRLRPWSHHWYRIYMFSKPEIPTLVCSGVCGNDEEDEHYRDIISAALLYTTKQTVSYQNRTGRYRVMRAKDLDAIFHEV